MFCLKCWYSMFHSRWDVLTSRAATACTWKAIKMWGSESRCAVDGTDVMEGAVLLQRWHISLMWQGKLNTFQSSSPATTERQSKRRWRGVGKRAINPNQSSLSLFFPHLVACLSYQFSVVFLNLYLNICLSVLQYLSTSSIIICLPVCLTSPFYKMFSSIHFCPSPRVLLHLFTLGILYKTQALIELQSIPATSKTHYLQ